MAAPSDDENADDGDEWEYSLADLEDESSEDGAADADPAAAPDERIDRSIDPESIDVENALFVVLGAVVAVLIIVRTAALFAP